MEYIQFMSVLILIMSLFMGIIICCDLDIATWSRYPKTCRNALFLSSVILTGFIIHLVMMVW